MGAPFLWDNDNKKISFLRGIAGYQIFPFLFF